MDFGKRALRIHGSHKNRDKAWREAPIKTSLIPLFQEWREMDKACGAKWLIHYNGRQIASIKKAWTKTLKRAGITRRIRPYDLRHAFATELIGARVDIGAVAKLMGHSSSAMPLKHCQYVQYVMDSQKRKAIESLPELEHAPANMRPQNRGVIESQ